MKKFDEKNVAENPLYHDTWKLLKKYRDVVWSLELSVQHVRTKFEIEYGTSIEDFLDSVYLAGADLAGSDIEHHAKCIERSHKMLKLLDSAVDLLRTKHKNGEAYYYNPDMRFDYVVGNPPFNLKWNTDQGEYLSQMYYCVKAAQLLKPLGIMAIIVPASFLADSFLDGLKISELEKDFSFLGQVSIPKGAFKYLGVTNFPTNLMFWQKKLDQSENGSHYDLNTANWFNMTNLDNAASLLDVIRKDVVAPAKERMQRDRSRAKLALHSGNDDDFHYQVQKMLYQIKSNPKIREKYAKCQEYIYKFEHQVMPENMKYEEWAKIRITEAKVLAYAC